MAISINVGIVTNLEKDIRNYAQTLLDGSKLSGLAEAFSASLKVTNTRNVKTITAEYVKKVADDLISQGMPKVSAKSMAKKYVEDQVNDIMNKIN
jgi:hypothetical protein